jgi:NO-binding membrane sensor protein with MHYT domain
VPFAHDLWLVALSYLIAAIGSYAALEMVERLRGAPAVTARFWLVGSAATFGGSVWAMHFIGMLAIRAGFPVAYDPAATIASLAIVVTAVGGGLLVARAGATSPFRLAVAGAVVGLGVAAMHYVGMAALLFPGHVAYHPGWFGLSWLVAVSAATAALWLSMTLDAAWQRAAAAGFMATGICAMHYSGMAATVLLFEPSIFHPPGIAAGPLAAAVGSTTLTLLALAIVAVAADRRVLAAADHEAEALRHANAELEATQREIVRRLCRAGEFRDSDTGEHTDRIGLLAHRLALTAGCEAAFAEALLLAAPLHDIGKIGVADSVLLKPGKLDAQEWTEMRRHSDIGHSILTGSGVKLLDLAAEIARSHHEKWDGTGYPAGLAGEAIPLGSRIVALVDVFDALLSRRPYKEPWPLDKVAAHIRTEAGKHFDPALVAAFLGDLAAMAVIHTGRPARSSTLEPLPPPVAASRQVGLQA